jgi:hypothetical protein
MIFTTSYCNKAHDTQDGKPIAHECYVLPVEALRLEREDKIGKALDVIRAAKPLKYMAKGKKQPC